MTANALKQPPAPLVPQDETAPLAAAPAPAPREPFVGECTSTRHPTLEGRVRVRWLDAAREPCERWLPILRGVVVRERDRLVVMPIANEPEPVVIGIVDGFSRRIEPPRQPAIQLEVRADETFQVTGERGQPLVEIIQGPSGPVVRLLHSDTELELPGKLRIRAAEIELSAARGDVRIEANDDVNIKGEMVRLN